MAKKKPAAKKAAKTPETNRQAATEFLHLIGHGLLQDPEFEDQEWEAIVMIVQLEEGCASVSGFRYDAKDKYTCTVPQDYDLGGDAEVLCDMMVEAGDARWKAILIQLTQPGPEIAIEFEYDDAQRWNIDFADFAQMAKKLRPKLA